jgi:hypothetical protein
VFDCFSPLHSWILVISLLDWSSSVLSIPVISLLD